MSDELGNQIVPATFRKSNTLISGKYKSSLLENKVFAVGLTKVKKVGNELIAEFHGAYLRKILSKNNGSFYDQLLVVEKDLRKREIIYENKEKNTFMASNIVTDTEFKNGVFKIWFNPKLERYILNLRSNYTILNMKLMMSFRSLYSYRLYELLKSKFEYEKAIQGTSGPIRIKYGISELKFIIGCIENTRDITNALEKSKYDYEYIETHIAEKENRTFEQWYDFKRYVLEVAIKEINNNSLSDITISYETIRGGRGGKVREIDFIVDDTNIVSKDSSKEKKDTYTADEKLQMVETVSEIFEDIPLKVKDIKSILIAADYDMDKIQKAYDLMEKNPSAIKNVVGWIIKAVKEDYSAPIEKDKKDKFKNFEERQYDFDDLERDLLKN